MQATEGLSVNEDAWNKRERHKISGPGLERAREGDLWGARSTHIMGVLRSGEDKKRRCHLLTHLGSDSQVSDRPCSISDVCTATCIT